jgi:hypothetical protein
VDVRNNLPEAVLLGGEAANVLRGNPVIIYANGHDREDAENLLTPTFEYSKDGMSWETSYLSGLNYDSLDSRWEITFTPEYDATLGTYDFRLNFTDTDGDTSVMIYEVELVRVLNNPPSTIDISLSANSLFRTDTILVFGTGFDLEDPQESLSVHFECQKPGESTWTTDYLFNPIFSNNQWQIDFTPPIVAPLGVYDFRVRFSDLAFYYSDWLYINGSCQVQNNIPQAIDIFSSDSEVLRGGSIYIYANGSDVETFEGNLRTEFEYRLIPGTDWENDSFSNLLYFSTFWRIKFSPSLTMEPGSYEFRAGFYDSDDEFSGWISLTPDISVLNNPPTVTSLDLEDSGIFRTESVLIYAEGSDLEDAASVLSATFQYKHSGSSSWTGLSGASYSVVRSQYEVSFTPSAASDIGDYDFRVKIQDSDGSESQWFDLDEGLEVMNNVPSVLNLTLSLDEIFRGEEVLLFAEGQDNDMDEDDLEPTFQYSRDGSTWETTYLGNPVYSNGKWQVSFSPPVGAQSGDYSFHVKFSDGVEESNWMPIFNALEVKNHLPSVSIETEGDQEGDTVIFAATVSDSEDSTSSLTFLWDFGDSETSSSESPTHTYEESGTYTVTLTVTDDDGGETMDTTSITVEVEPDSEPGPDGDTEDGFPLWILLLVIICIVVVILLFLLLKRKKPEEPVEAWPQEAGAVEETQTPEAPPAPPLPPPLMTTPHAPPPIESQPGSEKITKNIKCPSCQNNFDIELVPGTQRITCPHCGTSGNITI